MTVLRFVMLLACVVAVAAWGQEGHATIAQIASQLISAKTTSIVNQFLGGASMASVASDADDYRSTSGGYWSGPYHYINTVRTETVIHMDTDCVDSVCVVDAIYNYTKRFVNDTQAPFQCNLNVDEAEPCALVFLIHFVGDVHQPLHCGYGDDRGGNDIRVNWYGDSTNLHSVWDVSIIQKWTSSYTDAANQLLQAIKVNNPYTNTTDALAIANESLYWVENLVYDFSGTNLGDAYYQLALPVVKERLAAAGVRLAAILDANAENWAKAAGLDI